MPAPDPDALWISKEDGRVSVTYESYLWSNSSANRKRRATAILRRIVYGTWRCKWCLKALPEWRRADAGYCCEGCRKRAARSRRLSQPNFQMISAKSEG